MYKQISIRYCKKFLFKAGNIFCFSFRVEEFFLKIGEKYILFGRGMGPYFSPKNHEMRALTANQYGIHLTKIILKSIHK